jgi:hypothetical protein
LAISKKSFLSLKTFTVKHSCFFGFIVSYKEAKSVEVLAPGKPFHPSIWSLPAWWVLPLGEVPELVCKYQTRLGRLARDKNAPAYSTSFSVTMKENSFF